LFIWLFLLFIINTIALAASCLLSFLPLVYRFIIILRLKLEIAFYHIFHRRITFIFSFIALQMQFHLQKGKIISVSS